MHVDYDDDGGAMFECCKKVGAIKDAEISNLVQINTQLMEAYQNKMSAMMGQIDEYKKKMKTLQEKSSMPAIEFANTSRKNSNQTERMDDLKKKVKKLQDSVNYRSRRLNAMNQNRKVNEDKLIEVKKNTGMIKV